MFFFVFQLTFKYTKISKKLKLRRVTKTKGFKNYYGYKEICTRSNVESQATQSEATSNVSILSEYESQFHQIEIEKLVEEQEFEVFGSMLPLRTSSPNSSSLVTNKQVFEEKLKNFLRELIFLKVCFC